MSSSSKASAAPAAKPLDFGSEPDEHPKRRLLISAPDPDVLDTYAALLATHGFETFRGPLEFTALNTAKVEVSAVVLVGMRGTESTAISQVGTMRTSPNEQARNTPALLLGSSHQKLILAWESGIDGFLLLPVDLSDVVDTVNDIVARPLAERVPHRRNQLAQLNQ